MSFASFRELLIDAQQRRYAIGAFNVLNIEYVHAVLEVAAEENSPVILQINPIHFKYASMPAFIHYIKEETERYRIPVALNLDHGRDLKIIYSAIKSGFPSVMFDGSKLKFVENTRQTKTIAEICHDLGLTVEAELGKLNDEGVAITSENRTDFFTDPDEAQQFVAQTQIDALAVSIGNAHGFYKGEPELDFNCLDQIRKQVPVPLVLHGGSGIPDHDIRKAITKGICKINIYTEMGFSMYQRIQQFVSMPERPADFAMIFDEIREGIRQIVRTKIRLFGSNQKA